MKKGILCLLFLATLLQAFSKVVIYIDFKLNENYIAQTLCENKARPQLHCNGKCQLSKQLKKDEENSKENKKTIQEAVYYCNAAHFEIALVTYFHSAPAYQTHVAPTLQADKQRIFHPPDYLV
ncbi:hypothetical protein D3C72_564420 [compost metagenome]